MRVLFRDKKTKLRKLKMQESEIPEGFIDRDLRNTQYIAKKALSIADRAYVLETGKITMSGNAKDLLEDEAVKKAYLGE